ncbi:MAG TPA: OsmC family peroxiredoxin [Candidatus Acidoferrales bacterium]|jgi:osmotically inducible protein OsmC|nr:OsmC family peroxiredoxin [Candidatus Acidoferrales bacterium]
MSVDSSATATWVGDLATGQGTVRPASGAFPELAMTSARRFQTRDTGSSPEELIAAAHASCLSMALAHGLATAGYPPKQLNVTARVTVGLPEGISAIHLTINGKVPGIDAETFSSAVEAAKAGCPVSKALAAVPITAEATLEL